MGSKSDFESLLTVIFESLRQLDSKKGIDTDVNSNSIASLKSENLKLKEKNIFLEKKVPELQARLDRLTEHYQSALTSSQELKNIQEKLLKNAPKLLEEENAALSQTIAEMEIKLFHAEEEKKQSEEKWRLHQQKMDRLVELMSHQMSRLSTLETQLTIVKNTCKRIKPAARTLAQRSADLQLAHLHSRCRISQLSGQLAEERRLSAGKDAQLATTRANLNALEGEVAGYRTAVQEQFKETLQSQKQTAELESKLQQLQDKLEEAHETIRDQSEALARVYTQQ